MSTPMILGPVSHTKILYTFFYSSDEPIPSYNNILGSPQTNSTAVVFGTNDTIRMNNQSIFLT